MAARTVKSPEASSSKDALVREMLERVADKWTLLVIDALEGKTDVRFSRLRERIGDVSQKMLTKTLRQLERDGLVTRRVHAEVPPRVDYRLTPLGEPGRGRLQHVDVGRDSPAGRGTVQTQLRRREPAIERVPDSDVKSAA